MLSKFLNKYKISNKKLLVSVSGGVDSMVLCDLLLKSNLNYSIAHITVSYTHLTLPTTPYV